MSILESRAFCFPDGTEGDRGVILENNASYTQMEPFQRRGQSNIFFSTIALCANFHTLHTVSMQMFLSGEMLLGILARKDDKAGM